MPWNEVSRRYVDSDPEFYKPTGWRMKADNVKQGSSDLEMVASPLIDNISVLNEMALTKYKCMLEADVCPEQARMVLPQSMYTEWMWSGTLGSFLDMLKLRLDSHTQKETREIAEMIAVHVKSLFPVSYETVIEGE